MQAPHPCQPAKYGKKASFPAKNPTNQCTNVA